MHSDRISTGDLANIETRELTPEEFMRLAPVPTGAAWLAGIAVGLLLAAWLLIYVAVYLPRGMIG